MGQEIAHKVAEMPILVFQMPIWYRETILTLVGLPKQQSHVQEPSRLWLESCTRVRHSHRLIVRKLP